MHCPLHLCIEVSTSHVLGRTCLISFPASTAKNRGKATTPLAKRFRRLSRCILPPTSRCAVSLSNPAVDRYLSFRSMLLRIAFPFSHDDSASHFIPMKTFVSIIFRSFLSIEFRLLTVHSQGLLDRQRECVLLGSAASAPVA